jgi:hypothetical protein
MGLRLHVAAEPQWGPVDEAIERAAGRSLSERVSGWAADAAAYFTLLDGVPFIVEGLAAAALQGAPVPVDALAIAVPADDEEALDNLTIALAAMSAHRGEGFEDRDPRTAGSPRYQSMHGPLYVRLASPFEPVLWADIDPLPEPRLPLRWFLRESREPLPRARVAVTPVADVEAMDAGVRRVLRRVRERQPGNRASPVASGTSGGVRGQDG